jgi:hypothetical protein
MCTSGRSDQRTSGPLPSREPLRAGDGYLLLLLAEACGWTPTIVGRDRGVEVTLRHPVYGECALEGESVGAVAGTLVEWAFLRARLGAELQKLAELAQRCSGEEGVEVSRNGGR